MMAERGAGETLGEGFVAEDGGARWSFTGALTFANAGAVLAAAAALPLPASGVVDLAAIGAVDSATVAVLLALQRRANDEGRRLSYANAPVALASLADLYGVEEIVAG